MLYLILNANFIRIDSIHSNISINESPKVRISNSHGDIKIDTMEDVRIENDRGDIEIKSVNSYLDLQSEYGNININAIEIDKDSTINVDYGDINIKDTNEVYISAKTDLGNVEIKNNYKDADISLKIESDCGDILINN